MNNKIHNRVVEILYNIAKNHYKTVYADHGISQDYEVIDIKTKFNKRKAAKTYSYQPDLWCKVKQSGNIEVYEVWYGQSRESCIEDILFSALTPNIISLSIVCFDESTYKLADELVNVILYQLFDKNGRYLLNPSEVKQYITLIPEEIQNDDKKIEELLRKRLFKYWK